MNLSRFGGALALVMGMVSSACGSDDERKGTLACAYIEGGVTIDCTLL